ncbi:hypothetical protein ACSVH2_08845 [Flavobacterium sp. RSB2_4_14]
MRNGGIYYKKFLTGILTETNEGDYTFEQNEKYVMEHPKESITLIMPVSR